VVAMDSVIHYEAGDKVGALARLAERADCQVLFTFAPKTPLLAAMHTVGKAFPRGDRSPAIVPISEKKLRRLMRDRMPDFAAGNTKRIASGFYTSQAFQITRTEPLT
jgi:magnesium-protoporphyrin O-methyltransferase